MKKTRYAEYCERYGIDTIYLANKDRSYVLAITEGTGDNLSQEDQDAGYLDYWNVEGIDKDGVEYGGGILLLDYMIFEENPKLEDVVWLAKNSENLDDISMVRSCQLIDPYEGQQLYEEYEQKAIDRIHDLRAASNEDMEY